MKDEEGFQIEQSGDIDIVKIIAILWQERKLIVFVTLIFAVFSVIYALSIPNKYTASVVLAPSQYEGDGLNVVGGAVGGLASLGGIRLGISESLDSQIAQEVIQSRSFIEKFITDNNLAVSIFASKGWDAKQDKLILDNDLYNLDRNEWITEPKNLQPRGWDLYLAFAGMLNVVTDPKSGMVTVSLEHYSPRLVKDWLDLLIEAVNLHMQRRQINKVDTNIKYLQNQIASTSIADMKEVFYIIIQEQIKTKMLAEASPEFAFVTVSPSMVPVKKSAPARALICIFITFLGSIVALTLVLPPSG